MAEPELGTPFCGLSATALAEVDRQCKWRHAPITVGHSLELGAANITMAQCTKVLEDICAGWNSVCGCNLEVVASGRTNIACISKQLDGPNGVLAQAYLPCGNVGPETQLGLEVDDTEAWTLSFLKRTWLHEIGHSLGIDHAPRGTGAVMEPILTKYDVPQKWDVAEAVARYGPPVPTAPGDPTEPGNVFGKGVVIAIPAAGNYLFKISLTRR